MQTNVCCCALALLMDHSGTGWVQCPALCKAEGGEWPEQPSSDPAGRACVGWAGMGWDVSSCMPSRAAEQDRLGHLLTCPAAQVPPSASTISPLQGTHTQCSARSSVTRH